MDFDCFHQKRCQQLEAALEQFLPENSCPLTQAMHYVCFNGGKRLRPTLVYATQAAFSNEHNPLIDAAAAAVEFIHCYSLVHDDLPAMDDDDMRRGKPTCHIAFNEALAILVGDALQTLAFSVLSQVDQHSQIRLQLLNALAQASGASGMVLGQAIDIRDNAVHSLDDLKELHHLKTGRLISAAVAMGAIIAGVSDPVTENKLQRYAKHLGLAFQIHDDILDESSELAIMGKPAGSDTKNQKVTYVSMLGIKHAKQLAHEHVAQAKQALEGLSLKHNYLETIADFSISRKL